jgi:hypothetical protein
MGGKIKRVYNSDIVQKSEQGRGRRLPDFHTLLHTQTHSLSCQAPGHSHNFAERLEGGEGPGFPRLASQLAPHSGVASSPENNVGSQR